MADLPKDPAEGRNASGYVEGPPEMTRPLPRAAWLEVPKEVRPPVHRHHEGTGPQGISPGSRCQGSLKVYHCDPRLGGLGGGEAMSVSPWCRRKRDQGLVTPVRQATGATPGLEGSEEPVAAPLADGPWQSAGGHRAHFVFGSPRFTTKDTKSTKRSGSAAPGRPGEAEVCGGWRKPAAMSGGIPCLRPRCGGASPVAEVVRLPVGGGRRGPTRSPPPPAARPRAELRRVPPPWAPF